jgi:hypothetical protein
MMEKFHFTEVWDCKQFVISNNVEREKPSENFAEGLVVRVDPTRCSIFLQIRNPEKYEQHKSPFKKLNGYFYIKTSPFIKCCYPIWYIYSRCHSKLKRMQRAAKPVTPMRTPVLYRFAALLAHPVGLLEPSSNALTRSAMAFGHAFNAYTGYALIPIDLSPFARRIPVSCHYTGSNETSTVIYTVLL